MRAALVLAIVVLVHGPAAARPAAVPAHGEALYRRYCASCHGVGGKGDGPAAPAFTTPPTDLTRSRLSLPTLMQVIDGRRTVRAHGSATMPVWGHVFERELAHDPRQHRQTLRQVQAVAEYVDQLRVHR